MPKYEVVIGLEIHTQLNTRSKAFCADSTRFGQEPNTQISVVSLAHPGTLPFLNLNQVKAAIKLGLALGCSINPKNYFDRKNYFYADLPKGYQITQENQAICLEGAINFRQNNQDRSIRLNRIHMEEDAGKSIHDANPNYSFIDLNRAGVPLLEIVTEPDLRSAEEAQACLAEIRKLVRYLEISDGNMEEGSLRCDCNISLRPIGSKQYGQRCEIKNVNSLRNVKRAIEFEIKRQTKLLNEGKVIQQETRSFDAHKGTTASLRQKEDANDYRYFPDPDLPPLHLSKDFIKEIEQSLPELPNQLFTRFTSQYKLSEYDANILVENKYFAQYFIELCQYTPKYKKAANWMINTLRANLNEGETSIQNHPITPLRLAALIELVESGKVNKNTASQQIFPAMLKSEKAPLLLAQEMQVLSQSNASKLGDLIDQVLLKFPDKVKDYQSVKKKQKGVIGFLMGQIMSASRGKADPAISNKLLIEKLNTP